ncbi:MAG: CvpA family protein [Candidatus Marinimicrobia bacterium]|nr:CvpA family protein [Candidatus Neomarinimicrobiota bacterium]
MPNLSVDSIIIIALGFFAYKGMRKGLILEVFKLIGMFGGFLAAATFFSAGTGIIMKQFGVGPNVAAGLSFIIIFIAVAATARFIAASLKKLMQITMLGWVDSGGGALFGALKASFMISSVLLAISLIPGDFTKSIEKKSKFYAPMKGVAPAVYDWIYGIFPDALSFQEKISKTIQGYGGTMSGSSGLPGGLQDMMPDLKGLDRLKDLGDIDLQGTKQKKQIDNLSKKYGKK